MCGFDPLRRHHPNQRLALTWFQASCPQAAKLFHRKQRRTFGSLEVTPLSHANLHCVHLPVSTVVHASTLARSVSLMVPLGPQTRTRRQRRGGPSEHVYGRRIQRGVLRPRTHGQATTSTPLFRKKWCAKPALPPPARTRRISRPACRCSKSKRLGSPTSSRPVGMRTFRELHPSGPKSSRELPAARLRHPPNGARLPWHWLQDNGWRSGG